MNNSSFDSTADFNQTDIAVPPSADFPAPLSPTSLPLPNWLLAIVLLSVISKRLYQISWVVLQIVRTWKQPPADKTQ